MGKKGILIAALYLVIGLGGGFALARFVVPDKPAGEESKTAEQPADDPGESPGISEIMADLRSKKGEAFDKAYLSYMIEYNQGNIDMANLVIDRAEREEVKKWGDYVTKAQISDITQMKEWYGQWGFRAQDVQNAPPDKH